MTDTAQTMDTENRKLANNEGWRGEEGLGIAGELAGAKPRALPAQKEQVDVDSTGADFAFACIFPVLGFLFIKLVAASLVTTGHLGAGTFAFTVCTLVAVSIWLCRNGAAMDKSSWLSFVLILLMGAYVAIYDNPVLHMLALLGLIVSAAYHILSLGKRRVEDRLGDYLVIDAFSSLAVIPLRNMGKLFSVVQKKLNITTKGKSIAWVLCGAILTLPVTLYILFLLLNADAAFTQAWQALTQNLSKDVATTLGQILLSIPVSLYLFGLVYGTSKKQGKPIVEATKAAALADSAKIFPRHFVIGGTTPLLALYLLFFLSQTAYFTSAFFGVLPEGMVYSAYARRGFFELCSVCSVNLVFLGVLLVLTKERGEGAATEKRKGGYTNLVAVYGGLLSLFSIALIVMSLSKMLLYIHIFGLTQLRLYTSWFMVFLLFVFALALVRIARPGLNIVKICTSAALLMFLLLGYADTDRLIAWYNLEAYRAGKLQSLDVHMLAGLGSSATPYLIDIYADGTMDTAYRETAERALRHRVLMHRRKQENGEGWRSLTLAEYSADRMLLGYDGEIKQEGQDSVPVGREGRASAW